MNEFIYDLTKKYQNFCKKYWLNSKQIIGTIFAIIIIISIVNWSSSLPDTKPLTLIEKQFSAWDWKHINLTKFIKDNMKDPSSFEHIKSSYIDHWTYLTVTELYRGKNSFGAIVPWSIIANVDMNWNILKIISD